VQTSIGDHDLINQSEFRHRIRVCVRRASYSIASMRTRSRIYQAWQKKIAATWH